MRQLLPSPRPALWLGGVILAALLALFGIEACPAQASDPVEELRLALPMRLDDLTNPTPTVVDFRRKTLKQKIDALHTVGELRRALALEEWREDRVVRLTDEKLDKLLERMRETEAEMRAAVADRLTQAIRALVANKDDANGRLAAATLIAEMGASVRAIVKDDRSGFARSLTPEIIKLARDPDIDVRQQALRALGTMNASPREAAPVFVTVLTTDKAAGPRQLAATGLGRLVRVVSFLAKRGRAAVGVEAYRTDVLETAALVSQASAAGFKDANPLVRAGVLDAVQASAQALSELVPDGFPRKEFPPEGRPLSEAERKDLQKSQDVVRKDIDEIRLVFAVFRGLEPGLAHSLTDADPRVRLAAVSALEQIANTRLRLRRRVLSVPVPMGDKGLVDDLKAVDPLDLFLSKHLPQVSRLLADSDVDIRKRAIDFLEDLEEVAAPALPNLIGALADPNRFVRWSAARAIAAVGSDKATAAVPGLAKLLSDADLNVRLEASTTLLAMGDKAKAAVPALVGAVGEGDAESRLAAMYALHNMNPALSKAALPVLIQTLGNPEPRLRREAARALAKLGPVAAPALPALRAALGDDDADVRVNASDAILSIQAAPK